MIETATLPARPMSPEQLAEALRQLAERARRMIDREVLQLRYNVDLWLLGPDGRIKDRRRVHNLICTAGKNKVLAATSADYVNAFAYIAIGTGTAAAAAGDTTLQTEVARALSTVSNPSANDLRFAYTFPAGTGTGAITEAGVLDANSAGNLLARQVFTVVNKGASDTLLSQWDFT